MPIAIVVSLLLQLTCIVHVMRTGRERYWIIIILLFSLIGCLAYFLVELLPDLLGARGTRKLASGAEQLLNPDKAYREALKQVEISPTVHNKQVLANVCVERGTYDEAIACYDSILAGHDAYQPDLLAGRARALFLAGDSAGALADLDLLQEHNPDYRSADAHMTYARALEALGRDDEAAKEFEALTNYAVGEEARCRFALLLKKLGRTEDARNVFGEILQRSKHAPRHYVKLEREWIDVARANGDQIGGQR